MLTLIILSVLSLCVAIGFLLPYIILKTKQSKNTKNCENIDKEIGSKERLISGKYGIWVDLEKSERAEVQSLKEQVAVLREERDKIKRKKARIDCKIEDYCWWSVPFVLFCVTAIIFVITVVAGTISNKAEVAAFESEKQMIEECVINGESLENISITQTIIEKNSWLATAQADLKTLGAFSWYYWSGVENLEPIQIKRE